MDKTFEQDFQEFKDRMYHFEETSLRFQETALRSLIKIETQLKIIPGDSDLGTLAEIIRSDLQGVHDSLGSQLRKSSAASKGGRKFTRKKYK